MDSKATTWVDYDARIVVVDDNEANVELLQGMLEVAGYTGVVGSTDSSRAVDLCADGLTDMLLLDLHMPEPDGYEVLSRIGGGEGFPVIVLTADASPETKVRALAAGARDFLTKPFDRTEVLLRIENHLRIQQLQRQLRDHNERLADEVRERTGELERARHETLDRLALVAEYRDDDTGEHVTRVGHCCAAIAAALRMPDGEVELIGDAAKLHDVGKIGVPDRILRKPGRLSAEEFEDMKGHVALSERILAGSSSELLQLAERIARTHHERWDGTGYPRGLRGEEIPLVGRIAAVADVFDALTHARPYKEAWSVERAIAEITAASGTQFDPSVVDVFVGLDHRALRDAVIRPAGRVSDGAPAGAPSAGVDAAAPTPPSRRNGRGNPGRPRASRPSR